MGTIYVTVAVVLAAFVGLVGWGRASLRRRLDQVRDARDGLDQCLVNRTEAGVDAVEMLRPFAEAKRGVLEAVVAARTGVQRALSGDSMTERETAWQQFEKALGKAESLADSTPELFEHEPYVRVRQHLAETDSLLEFAQRHYNDSADELNRAASRFPAVLAARFSGVNPVSLFEASVTSDRGGAR